MSLRRSRSLRKAAKLVVRGVRSDSRKRIRGRSGQSGYVVRKGDVWHGRFYVDVPGQEARSRKSVPIGPAVGDSKLTKSEAKNKLQDYLQQIGINKASYLQKTLEPVQTFKEVAEWYMQNKLPFQKPSSKDSGAAIIKANLIPAFGHLNIDKVDERAVQEWVSDLHKKSRWKPKTIHNNWKYLRIVLGKRHVSGWDVKLPTIVQLEQRYFTPEEVDKIVDTAEGQYKALFALQFATGMRFGELAGLHVEDLDFEESVVHVRRSVYRHQEVTPKTAAGYRDVDVHPNIMTMLKEHVGDRQSGIVFTGRRGKHVVCGNVNRYFLKPILKKLGLPIGTSHAMRHGRVSVLQQNQVPGD
jgi:integrase